MKFNRKSKFKLVNRNFGKVSNVLISVIVSTIITTSLTHYFNTRLDQRIANRQFVYDFSRTFFDNPKYRKISIAIEEQYLYNKEDKNSTISEYEIDDYLGLLYDVWSFYTNGFISRELLDDQYGYYLCISYNSKLIKNYREKLKRDGFPSDSIYPFLDEIAEEFNFNGQNCKQI